MIKLVGLLSMLFALSVNATDIQLTWEKPTEREDGSQIQTIDRYNLYHTVDNVLQSTLEVPADLLSFTIYEVETGVHTFQISTVEDGLEGEQSGPVTVNLLKSAPVRIELTVRVID